MRKIESYRSPEEVHARVKDLRESGVMEEAIAVIAKPDLYDEAFRTYHLESLVSKVSTWDKFMSLFSSDHPESRVVSKLDLTDEENEHYQKELAEGAILLYVNDYESLDGHASHIPKITGGSNFTSDKTYEGNEQ